MTRAGFESMTKARPSMMVGSASRFGDGKPVILVAPWLGSDLAPHPSPYGSRQSVIDP
jgi:hypothetical protein